MLRLILKENSFHFNGNNHLQTHGTAMGTKMAVSFIFMAAVEKEIISRRATKPLAWKRLHVLSWQKLTLIFFKAKIPFLTSADKKLSFLEIYIYFQFSDFPFALSPPPKAVLRFGFCAWQLWHDFCSCAFHYDYHFVGYECIFPLRDFFGWFIMICVIKNPYEK